MCRFHKIKNTIKLNNYSPVWEQCLKTCLHQHERRNVYTNFEYVFENTFTHCETDAFTQCLKACFHHILKRAYTLYECSMPIFGDLFVSCLKACYYEGMFSQCFKHIQTMFEDMFIQCWKTCYTKLITFSFLLVQNGVHCWKGIKNLKCFVLKFSKIKMLQGFSYFFSFF